MRRSAHVAVVFLAAALLYASAEPALAQDKARARPKAAPVDERAAGIDEAMRLSGLRNHFGAVRQRLRQTLEDAGQELAYDARQWLWKSLDASFSPHAYMDSVKQALLDNYDADAVAGVLVWYRSAPGKALVRLEQSGAEPGRSQARKRYLATLEAKQPSESRLVLIFRIDEASRASDDTLAAMKAVAGGWSRGIEEVVSEREPERAARGELARDTFRAQARDAVSEDVMREMLYTYRDLSDAELRAYAGFLESDAGKWLFNAVYKGGEVFLEKVVSKVAEEYVANIYDKQTPRPRSGTATEQATEGAAPMPAPALPRARR